MKSIVLSVCIFLSAAMQAQTSELLIKSGTKGLYLEHKITPKENFYSIGRLFNVHPKHLATFNSLDMTKGLSIGQIVRIPLTDTNFNQKTEKGQPIYYITSNGESLYRVSTNNNNVLMERLGKWNHLSKDNIAAGTKLIVGFLVNNGQPAVAAANPPKEVKTDSNAENTKKEVAKNETISNPENIKKEVAKNEAISKPESKKEDTKKEVEPVKTQEAVMVKEEIKPQQSTQGYFKTSFDQQIKQQPISKQQTVTAGIFKTASGWVDAKYYLLMDGAEPGIIVRITNPANNKIIYAKLLGEMNGLKQNQGLTVRISNAAAAALDITETDKFIVKLNY
ncbi:MAG TPA: LysM peptidoglycan-binding domain-containing protein [Chitinophagaceae bacterium]|jgi:LysM repeat protein|nr:LysM peptidoglycan-binding domain-containing protein [Chitinophagaceae bacterium]